MIAQTTRMFHAAAPRHMGAALHMQPTCAVQLVDRRTGSAHRINGTPLVIFTRDPAAAAEDLLEGRDPAHWDVKVHQIETQIEKRGPR